MMTMKELEHRMDNKKPQPRVETDSIGPIEVPLDKYLRTRTGLGAAAGKEGIILKLRARNTRAVFQDRGPRAGRGWC